MRPARSSTATCFCTAAKLMSYRAASSDTDGVSMSDRARMSRRVPSARARNSWLIASSLSRLRTTIWLYVYHRTIAFASRIRPFAYNPLSFPLALSSGTRLGAYEVVAAVGEGGMGEVYRARDTKLNRDVALKILPDAFAADPERLARFKREAQVLASLNHPNIGAIYGFEDSGSTHALILELVEGQTLAELLSGLPIPNRPLRKTPRPNTSLPKTPRPNTPVGD